ncbi:cysteine-rich perinuclear theca protein 1-like [Mus caroli]|uniref:Cysteine-rich perinuclear theca protein 1-like n=1 Tax=Mus caroli TaxID=10089 RepID=A0A6P7QXP3_MUSCR|nr:cysteine-rich perinuclear theca protein 1-like [Mus caroli]
MARVAQKVHWSRAAATAATAAKAKRPKLKKTAAKRFKLNRKQNPRSKLPKRSCRFFIHSLSHSGSRCCCGRSCRSCRRTAFKITKKGEQSLRRRIRRRIKSATELRLMQSQLERSQLELIEPEPTMALETSEITVALFSHENANVSEPEEVPPFLDSDWVLNGDLASS